MKTVASLTFFLEYIHIFLGVASFENRYDVLFHFLGCFLLFSLGWIIFN